MKKLWLVLVLIVPFFFFGCESEEIFSTYNICAEYDKENNQLNCQQEVDYVNNSSNILNKVCFFLYANAFDEDQKPVSVSSHSKAYYNGESYGNITVESAFVNGAEAIFEISEAKNVLTIELQEELFPNEIVEIEITYQINLANINHRLGRGENTINFGNFFPRALVYEDGEGFIEQKLVANGDPFYSDISNYQVELTFDQCFDLASTGTFEIELNGDKKTAFCKAEKVRDFCFVLSEKFDVLSQDCNGVQVNYFYYDEEEPQSRLQTCVDALRTFETLYGEYPYKQLSVVKSSFCYGGMEYPNLVLISDDLEEMDMDYVIVHEIAHQWWYSVVGNNQYDEAWLDESVTEFSTMMFYAKNEGYGVDYQTLINNAKENYVRFVEIFSDIKGDVDQSMNRSLDEFKTEPEYVNCVYVKGVLLYDSLRDVLGEKKLLKCLKSYFEQYSYKNAKTEDLIHVFSKTSKINLQAYFDSWLNGSVVIE
ncbi:MAG: M1 family metallopeptidase [Clostridiales bacterium]|nr:M1 family metallopeptidase [Clostridiales bacterium]